MLDQRTRPIAVPGANRRPRLRVTMLIVTLVIAAILGYVIFQAVAAGESAPARRVATVVFDRTSGEQVIDDRGSERFRTASVVKLFIALDAVTRKASRADEAQIHRMPAKSDDAVANTLWTKTGGPAIATRTVATAGLKNTTPPADGFDQYFGIPSAFGDRPWAVKQGWAAGRGSVDAHTTGLVGEGDRYIVVILSGSAEGTGLDVATAAVTSAAKALASRLEK
ncbi:hypothetical protein [Amycolatopsis sp. NPDC102389]|uniref:hypothetical protein n=1 Tax=Amycolatopsis sp. NPDC102389 TaxID=3363941 RepID=UPI00382180FC